MVIEMGENNTDKWQRMYELLKFAKENPNNNERISFSKLGSWVASQRLKYQKGKLSLREIKLLEDIGIDLDAKPKDREIDWDKAIKYI